MKRLLLFSTFWVWFIPAGFAQQQVSGVVKDYSTDEPLPGVNILIKGTGTGTITDIEGNYKLTIPDNDAVLAFSFIGYETIEIAVSGQPIIDVGMMPDLMTLDELVVTGYGTIKKGDMTSAHATIGSEQIRKSTNTTIEQAIQGRAAGVFVTQNSGQPGGGVSVNIRGVNSINGTNQPLYVIDGVQVQVDLPEYGAINSSNPLAGLNPSDIESMQILQGPSATSLYGSRATNGVIVITTKRGKEGDIQISYGYQYSLQTEPKKLDVMNLREYAQMVNEYHAIAGGNAPEELTDPSVLGEGTDWQEELFDASAMNKHQLSIGGGSEKLRYFLSGEYLDQEGVVLGSGFNRYSIRLNLDNQATDWLSIGANLSFNQTKEELSTNLSLDNNIISSALQLSPAVPVRKFDGTFGGADINNPSDRFMPPNPIALASFMTNDLTKRQLLSGFNFNADIIEGLTFRTAINTNLGFDEATYFAPKYQLGYSTNSAARLENRTIANTYWNWNQLVQYDRSFGRHSFSLMANHESQASTYKNITASRVGFDVDIQDLNGGDIAGNVGGQSKWAMESYLGRINYNYDDRYLLMGAFRADGSVNFGRDNRWGYFPSLSAAWRISEEAFFNVDFISDLKLRYETGLTGNQGGSGNIFGVLNMIATPWGSGFLPRNYANKDLKWEETLTNNIGLNLALFRNRIQFEFDYYVKNTDNLLIQNPLPDYMGTDGQNSIAAPFVNIGSLENKGWSFAINTVNIDRGDFRWESNLNVSSFKTKIEDFYTKSAHVDRTSHWLNNWTQRSVVGAAPWQFYGYVEEGLFQSIEEIENSALPVDNDGNELSIAENSVWVGDVKYKDINDDGIIDERDQTFIGNPWPKLFAGFTNTFSYKGFELNVLLTSVQGNDVYNYVAFLNTNPNNVHLSRNFMSDAANYAKVAVDAEGNPYLENPETSVPRISSLDPNGNFKKHTNKYVEDGSFVRIKNISLTFNLSPDLLSNVKFVRGARVSLSAQNVATFTKYSGYDPEIGSNVDPQSTASNQAIGLDGGRYPLTPVYSVSFGIDF